MRFPFLVVVVLFGISLHGQDLSMQNGTFNRCQPDRFFDSGGEFGNYDNDENLVTTICPQNAGEFMVVEFINFTTQLNLDILTIYDGDSTAAPVIGTYTGAASPGTIQASTLNTSGCLTFQFVSNATSTTTGWEANIGCATPCQTIVASIDTTTPEPNPSGVVVILPGTEVTFNGSATFSDDDTDATYDWNFADGNSDTGTTVSNIFNTPGTYNVTLTVTDNNPQSCTDIATITVVVIGDTVIVDQTSFTPEQLIEDVLINSPCASVTNIISSTGTDFSAAEPNGIGYFISNGTNFEFLEGLLLTTGNASSAEGPEQGTLSEGSFAWPGDNDLENAIGLGIGTTNNATFIQFDFEPLADRISFDFVFASEEYGGFQCQFTDAFAFLLTNNVTGVTTNLAIVPGTTDVVSVLTVRDNAFNGACPSVNPNFFDSFYGAPPGLPVGDAPIDFRGYTTPMTAESNVTPGTNYTIKLVIADDTDTLFDAAVFLEAGSFDLGGDLGEDITIAAGTAECDGDTITLDTGLPTATHTWFQDGTELTGETGSTLVVDEAGEYSVIVEFSPSCQSSDSIIVQFRSSPTANQPLDLVICDVDGTAQFDLSENDDDVLGAQDPMEFLVTYHLTEDDAINNVNPLPVDYTNTSNPQTIWVRIADNTQECFDTNSFQLLFSQLDINDNITPIEECDDLILDGITEFNLLDRESEILDTNDPADVNITFHLTIADAENDLGALPNLYTNVIANNQTIYVRLETVINEDCYDVTTMDLVVLSNPLANQPTDFEVCDDDGDGFSVFALSTKTPEVDGGQPGVVVSYHLTPADAATGTDALPDPYTNAVADTQEVYVRVEDTVTGCFSTTTLQLVVHPAPTTVATDDLVLCDDNNPGDLQEVFDLSVKDVELIDGQANVTVSYYPSQADADALTNEITAPYANTGTPQTIVAVLTDALTGCSSQIAFDLVVEALPTAIVPTPLEVCDDGTPDGITQIDLSLKDTEVSGGNGTYLVSYHETQLDADLGQNDLPVPYTNLFNNQVVIVRVEDSSTGCHATVPLELVVEQAPVAFVPQPLVFCDPDSDGFGTFDLTLADAEITGGDATLGVTYHETQANADNGVDAIDTTVPYNNIVQDAQTLYARVESPTIATACATVVELELLVEPTPQLGEADPLEECDDASADGLAQFDLTAAAADILDGLDPAQYTLSYYESEAAADAGAPAIAVPTAYTNTVVGMQTVWVRVDDTATLGGCYKLAELELIVNPLPVLSVPPPLSLCDALTPGDEQEPFDLTDADAAILGGQTGIVLTYHETQADADAGTAAITGPYLNLSNAQTVYVRGEDEVTGCHSTVTLTLRVDPVPSPEPDPDPIEVCDDDNDGFAEFDLEIRTVEITNGEADVAITYHETLEEAQQGDNPILGLYTNIVPDSQQIYVRAENTLTGCFSLTLDTLELIVVPSPDVPEDLPPLVRCDDDDDGITQFDLTEMDALVLGGQDPAQVDLTYHIDPVDATTGANPIANVGNYTNTSNPQVIYVRLYDPLTGCLDTGEFELQVELPPVAVQPSPLELCDDLGEPGDEVRVFDLTVKDTEITGGNPSWTVSYYETDADAQAQTGAIPDPTQYTNTSVGGLPANPQTLYVVVTDNDTGCIDFATLTLRVLPNPTPTPSDQLPDLELCDDVNVGDGVETFDLTENEALLLNGETGVTPTYHTSAADADSGANAIPDPTAHVNTSSPVEIIYVRVENDVTGCYTVVEFSITVNPLPAAVAVTDFIQCELFTDGFAQFDLTLKDAEVLNGQDPSAYTVSYHESEADAQALDNAITGPYTNTSNPQTIYVAITDNVTGCSVSTQRFDIEVQEAAQANPIGGPLEYALCDDEVETDGDPSNDSVQFQLSTQNGEVLDLQDPADYAVSYYATLADAEFFVNPLPDLYENATNPQTIYVRVDNDTPDGTGQDTSTCFDITTMELRVDPLPVIVLEESYLLCVGTDGSEVVDIPVLDTGLSATDYTFVWSLDGEVLAGETGPSLVPQQGGSYSVLVEDIATGCFNEGITVVEESGPPDLEAELVSEAFTGSNVIQALATGIGVYEYSLDGGPWQDDGVFFDVRPGIRTVYARDINGCGVASVEVTVIDFPRFFTPNGDGNNDTWNIVGIGGQPNAKIYIFDRYGKLLKQLAPNGAGWDGTFNGNRMPTSDYWFTLTYEEPLTGQEREFKAHFTLKR